MKYKLILSDFDGTLTNSKNQVSERAKKAIKAFMDKGGKFVVATGRMYPTIINRMHEVGLDDMDSELVSFQGAYISNIKTGEELARYTMQKEAIYQIVKHALELGIYVHIYTINDVIVREYNDLAKRYCEFVNVEPIIQDDLLTYIKNSKEEFVKAIFIVDKENTSKIVKEFNSKFYDNKSEEERILFVNSAPTFVECVDYKTNKGHALRLIADKYNIDYSQTVAFGDSMNDASMLKAAAVGVAMGNGTEEVKAFADIITDSVDDDGLAKIIEKIVAGEDII